MGRGGWRRQPVGREGEGVMKREVSTHRVLAAALPVGTRHRQGTRTRACDQHPRPELPVTASAPRRTPQYRLLLSGRRCWSHRRHRRGHTGHRDHMRPKEPRSAPKPGVKMPKGEKRTVRGAELRVFREGKEVSAPGRDERGRAPAGPGLPRLPGWCLGPSPGSGGGPCASAPSSPRSGSRTAGPSGGNGNVTGKCRR